MVQHNRTYETNIVDEINCLYFCLQCMNWSSSRSSPVKSTDSTRRGQRIASDTYSNDVCPASKPLCIILRRYNVTAEPLCVSKEKKVENMKKIIDTSLGCAAVKIVRSELSLNSVYTFPLIGYYIIVCIYFIRSIFNFFDGIRG